MVSVIEEASVNHLWCLLQKAARLEQLLPLLSGSFVIAMDDRRLSVSGSPETSNDVVLRQIRAPAEIHNPSKTWIHRGHIAEISNSCSFWLHELLKILQLVVQ